MVRFADKTAHQIFVEPEGLGTHEVYPNGISTSLPFDIQLDLVRSMRGFVGPKDIFRNPESMFRQFEKTQGDSPFPLVLSSTGDDFAVMGMHFKLGLYEHQSAGALQGMIDLVRKHPVIAQKPQAIKRILITAYEPAFGIIGDPAKRDFANEKILTGELLAGMDRRTGDWNDFWKARDYWLQLDRIKAVDPRVLVRLFCEVVSST